MKTPTIDDKKPNRDKLGPTGPAMVEKGKAGDSKKPGSASPADESYDEKMERILERKRDRRRPPE